jgi:14-3-3 protein epsilon
LKNARKDDSLRLGKLSLLGEYKYILINKGIALNYSVMYYEIKDDTKKAYDIGTKAFDEALKDLADLEEERYKDSTTIMQLIKDNLTAWKSELPEVIPSYLCSIL